MKTKWCMCSPSIQEMKVSHSYNYGDDDSCISAEKIMTDALESYEVQCMVSQGENTMREKGDSSCVTSVARSKKSECTPITRFFFPWLNCTI